MTSPAGNYVTSYDTGSKPFTHDNTRGKWSSQTDFYLACISHAFGLANFSMLPVFIMMHGGVFFIVPYTISLLLFTLPIFFIQSFLGQFSSTGFISVYRISPLFKGIGYVILVLNIISACVNSVIAAYVLTYFFASFSIDLPWMSCNHTWNNENCTETFKNDSTEFYDISWSTAEYFESEILNFNIENFFARYTDQGIKMAWPIFGSNIVVWIVVGLLIYKGMESVIKFVKYSAITIFSILIILSLRFACFPGSVEAIGNFLTPTANTVLQVESWFGAPFLTILTFGSGWGTVLTMASFNNFKTNIIKSTLIISFALLLASIMAGVLVFLADNYLTDYLNFDIFFYHEHPFTFMFLGFPYLFGNMEASQMWSLMFFFMLTLCEVNAVVLVMFTTITSLFDEYEYLRIYKKEICIGLPAVLFIFSIIFTTNHGYELYIVVMRLCGVTQMEICFLEIIIVVWIYGRQRFQRDLQFMLGKNFTTWQFYLTRFITPIFILFVLLLSVLLTAFDVHSLRLDTFIILVSIKFLPWICIPAYIGYKLFSTSGSIKIRLRRCIRPNDWYPVDPSDRQSYEEALGNSIVTHQLVDMNDLIDDDD